MCGIVMIRIAALLLTCAQFCSGLDLLIRIPGVTSQDGFYRMDYSPPNGSPKPNTTFLPQDINETIYFSQGLPGTKYIFWLYYSNATINDWLTWTASVTTVPDPPANLTINFLSGKEALLKWDAPAIGSYSGFILEVIPISEPQRNDKRIEVGNTSSSLTDLTPGATYELRLYSTYENKESQAYIATNITTRPNPIGGFLIYFRNETAVLVTWKAPFPFLGLFSKYRVTIELGNAKISEIDVPNEGKVVASGAFNELIPGKAYNITVETVSKSQISNPVTGQYRTVPLKPTNVKVDVKRKSVITVYWEAPQGISEFDHYQVTIIDVSRENMIAANNSIVGKIESSKRLAQISPIDDKPIQLDTVGKDETLIATFEENLEPGKFYRVEVKTVSGEVESWPAKVNLTLSTGK